MNSGTLNSCAELCLCTTLGRKKQDGFCLSRTDWCLVECPHVVSASHKNEAGWFIRVFFQCDYLIKTHLNCPHQLYSFILVSWSRKCQPTSVFLPGKFHGGAWWAAVHGVAKSWTWLRGSMHTRMCTRIHTHTHTSWFHLFLVLSYLLSDGKNFSYFNFLNPKISYTLKLFILVFKTNNKKSNHPIPRALPACSWVFK